MSRIIVYDWPFFFSVCMSVVLLLISLFETIVTYVKPFWMRII